MNIHTRLERWSDAGIISQAQIEQIHAFERERPSATWFIYTLVGLGTTVVLIGVISIIAANWEAISPGAKLVSYFVSLALLSLVRLAGLNAQASFVKVFLQPWVCMFWRASA